MTDTKTLLARLEAAVVQGNTLPAFVRRYDEDWDWLNAEEMLFQFRQGIVQDCRYLLTLNTAEERAVVSKCFESREDANAIARESKQWGVPQAQVDYLNDSGRNCFHSISVFDMYDFIGAYGSYGDFHAPRFN